MMTKIVSHSIMIAAAACLLLRAVAIAQQPLYPVVSIPRFVDAGSLATQVSFQITNAGGGTLSWSIGDIAYKQADGWISTIAPRSGSTQTASTVTLGIIRQGLPQGRYSATLPVFSNGGSAEVTVSMEVAPAFVDTASVHFGTTLTADSIKIRNYTQADLVWNAVCRDADNQSVPWLSLNPQSGALAAGDNQTLILNVDRTGLAAGAYSATIEFTIRIGDEHGVERVAVTMTVSDDGGDYCPIAFALDDPEKSDLAALRTFRDTILSKTRVGRACIMWYYGNGREIFGLFGSCPTLRQSAAVILRTLLPLLKTCADPDRVRRSTARSS